MWKRKTFQSGTWFPTGGRVEVTPGKSSKEVSLLSVIFHFFKTKLIFVQDVINVKISSICLVGIWLFAVLFSVLYCMFELFHNEKKV